MSRRNPWPLLSTRILAQDRHIDAIFRVVMWERGKEWRLLGNCGRIIEKILWSIQILRQFHRQESSKENYLDLYKYSYMVNRNTSTDHHIQIN